MSSELKASLPLQPLSDDGLPDEIAVNIVSGQRFCKYCGYPLRPDVKKCPKCGKPQE